ncbi:hypothetical protein, partial [Flavonifractor plautii]|uniref:hypothetical protein n=1 Tax=Flavonifractor plautii TaxID=292800 RepID=UPI003522B02D
STITPDEGRNVPWHIYNIEAIDNAKQTLIGLDGLMEMVDWMSALVSFEMSMFSTWVTVASRVEEQMYFVFCWARIL